MKHLENWIHKLVFVCVALLLGLITLLVILQITFRFVLNDPLPWPEELSRLLFIYLVFIGGAVSSRNNDHIGIDLIDHLVTVPKRQAVLHFLRLSATSLVLVVVAFGSLQILPNIAGMKLPATGLPMALMTVPVFVGSVLMAFWTLIHSGKSARIIFSNSGPVSGEERGEPVSKEDPE
ncbi:MAG: TRAP transporter small permease [Verrucomicrobia bacterium]|nr:TRAP transporter small permease [Verrucomicrobiota bacterium]MDA1067056.1 TRAP transporter small permease [Verrucomicrobiota bacterium]